MWQRKYLRELEAIFKEFFLSVQKCVMSLIMFDQT